ncbi:hypothetical protein Prum_003080 [Phytohabitans rumicis]|uniref:Uncharacterized protein n=1 Tax=Phytohabitans rumicis TaxID=1076125 RepID=A0A6V8KXX1_9ACTN|nr:hypothetical protein Prum_003080 [Phytohabitans rumicis]
MGGQVEQVVHGVERRRRQLGVRAGEDRVAGARVVQLERGAQRGDGGVERAGGGDGRAGQVTGLVAGVGAEASGAGKVAGRGGPAVGEQFPGGAGDLEHLADGVAAGRPARVAFQVEAHGAAGRGGRRAGRGVQREQPLELPAGAGRGVHRVAADRLRGELDQVERAQPERGEREGFRGELGAARFVPARPPAGLAGVGQQHGGPRVQPRHRLGARLAAAPPRDRRSDVLVGRVGQRDQQPVGDADAGGGGADDRWLGGRHLPAGEDVQRAAGGGRVAVDGLVDGLGDAEVAERVDGVAQLGEHLQQACLVGAARGGQRDVGAGGLPPHGIVDAARSSASPSTTTGAAIASTLVPAGTGVRLPAASGASWRSAGR